MSLTKKKNEMYCTFGVSMVWREPKAHGNECYFCSCNIAGFNARNKHYIHYPNVPSGIRPVPHGPGVPIPTSPAVLKDVEESDAEISSSESRSADDSEYECNKNHRPTLFGQEEPNDLVRDLELSKLFAFLLGSRVNSKHLLHANVTFSWYKRREKEYLPFFYQ